MKKGIVVSLVLIAVIATSAFVYQSSRKETSQTPATEGEQVKMEAPSEASVSTAIDFGNGEVFTFIDENGAGKSAYDLLQTTIEENNLALTVEQYDFGVFVKAIGEYESSAEKSWIYFVNGQSGSVAADTYMTNPGDTVEWKYIEPTE